MAELTVSPQNRRKGWNKNVREPEHASTVDHYSYLYSQTQSHTKVHRVYTATACCPNHCSSKPGKREERGMPFKMAVFMRWVTSCDTSHPVIQADLKHRRRRMSSLAWGEPLKVRDRNNSPHTEVRLCKLYVLNTHNSQDLGPASRGATGLPSLPTASHWGHLQTGTDSSSSPRGFS